MPRYVFEFHSAHDYGDVMRALSVFERNMLSMPDVSGECGDNASILAGICRRYLHTVEGEAPSRMSTPAPRCANCGKPMIAYPDGSLRCNVCGAGFR